MTDLRTTYRILAITGVFLVAIQCDHFGATAAEGNNCKPKLSPIVLSKQLVRVIKFASVCIINVYIIITSQATLMVETLSTVLQYLESWAHSWRPVLRRHHYVCGCVTHYLADISHCGSASNWLFCSILASTALSTG